MIVRGMMSLQRPRSSAASRQGIAVQGVCRERILLLVARIVGLATNVANGLCKGQFGIRSDGGIEILRGNSRELVIDLPQRSDDRAGAQCDAEPVPNEAMVILPGFAMA